MSQSSSTLVGHDAHLWTESGDDVYRSSGSVGIGTAVPSTSLHVLSNSGTSMTDTGYDGVTIESSAANEPSVISFRPANDDGNLALVAKIGATSTGATTNYNGSLGFSTRTGGVMSQQMTIDSAGLVGIGTDSPTEQLHVLESSDGDWVARFEQDHATGYGLIVEHAGSVDNRYGLAVYDGSNFDFVVTTAGNVGIGTETPLAVLGVKGASGASADSGTAGIFHITTGDAATDEQLQIGITDEVGPWLQGIKKDTAYRNIALQTQGGKVGIGVAVPATKLTVEGSVTLKEQAAADSDTEAYGQIWVKTGTPNTLYFTDDAGTDVQLGAGSSSAWTTSGSDIYYNTGGVGIGTASPADYYSGADNLVVYEAGDAGITIATGTTNTGALYFADGTTGDAEYRGGIGYIHATATERLALVSGGAEKVTILDSGEVGIGTTVPSVLLHCSGGANEAGLRLERSSGLSTDGTTYIGSLEFEDDAETPVKLRAVRTGSGGAAAMTFETGDATNPAVEAMRITSSGVVKLNQEAESEIAFRRNNTGTAMDCGKITFGDNTDARAQIQGETTTTSDDGELTFSTADSGTLTEAMRITSDGNVLVGAAPKIHANSTAAYYTNQAAGKTILSTFDSNEKVTCDATGYMEFETDGVAALRIDSSQNVGIGTASPAQRLHVYDADYAYARFSTSEFSTGLDVGINDDLNEAFIRMRENTPLTFWTNNVERMTIDSGGQVSQPVETLTTDDTVDIDFSKSNLQTFTLDGSESQTELTGSNYAAGRTVRLMIDMSSDGHMGGITTPSNWTNFGDDPASISSAGLVLCELTSWTAAEGGVTARWSESTV